MASGVGIQYESSQSGTSTRASAPSGSRRNARGSGGVTNEPTSTSAAIFCRAAIRTATGPENDSATTTVPADLDQRGVLVQRQLAVARVRDDRRAAQRCERHEQLARAVEPRQRDHAHHILSGTGMPRSPIAPTIVRRNTSAQTARRWRSAGSFSLRIGYL